MPQDPLGEREFELINIVGAQLAANQRQLSQHMNMSLGMTNMLLRRLINKGYIRINQLNKKKAQYLLTPKGFSEKMRKTVRYTIKTINSINLIRKCFNQIVARLWEEGERTFYVLGDSDFASLVEAALKELHVKGYKLVYIKTIGESKPDGVLCICREGAGTVPEGRKYINFIEELAHDEELAAQGIKES